MRSPALQRLPACLLIAPSAPSWLWNAGQTEKLMSLKNLFDAGVLTENEFEEKRKTLVSKL